MTIRVYNTLSKSKEVFEPVTPGQVGMYLCGPTVYDKAHIGHMVGPVVFDAIKRYLVYCGYDVTWVVNITDVDDKLINKANERGISMEQVAKENTADYLHNLAGLGVGQIDHMPKATESMEEIISLIQGLIDQDFAYAVDGDVFFDVGKDPQYGKLSNRSADSQQGEGGEAAARKRSPSDFALWKSAKPGEPSWDSPWGSGRPGWHIECSAMSRQLLGKTFDIHGGGLDLVFPHHENEIAQSECCHGQPMAKYWMHNGLMRAADAGKVGGRAEREQQEATVDTKISRSKGAGGLADLIERHGGQVIRFFLLRSHYRSTIVFGDQGLEETKTALESFTRFFERYQRVTGDSFYELTSATRREDGELNTGDDPLLKQVAERRQRFLAKMDDDFNTGAAISELFELLRILNKSVDEHHLEDPSQRTDEALSVFCQGVKTLRELTNLFGLFLEPPQEKAGGDDEMVGKLLDLLVQLRNDARAEKNFSMADKVRDSLADLGVTLEDRKEGTAWRLP
jgi:cysteinyl-tRNA synthetase